MVWQEIHIQWAEKVCRAEQRREWIAGQVAEIREPELTEVETEAGFRSTGDKSGTR